MTSYTAYVRSTKNPLLKAVLFFKAYIKILTLIGSYSLIHLNTTYPFGIFALHQKLFKKKKYIISEHWTGYLIRQKKRISSTHNFITKYIIKKATYVCPVSNELKLGMQNLGFKGNYFPVGNVINTTIFKPTKDKKDPFTIVHVSGLNDAQKNISDMLKTAKKLEQKLGHFTWKFIGGAADSYQKLITELQFKSAKIEFTNHVSQKELANHLKRASVCVSFSNYETFGIVMPEAIACGTFVVSTNTGILNELEPQNFFSIIDIKNSNDLAKEIINQYKNPTKLNTEDMRNFVKEKFSKQVISEIFSNLYAATLNSNN